MGRWTIYKSTCVVAIMKICVLTSGSVGNSTYIETGKEPPEKSVSEWIDSNGLFEAAKQEYIKELIKAEEGQNNMVEINP